MMAQVNAGRVRFVGRGEYNNSTQYYVFDLVNYNGNSYYAKVDTIGHLPTDTTYWQLVAEKGNVGPTGLTGNGISTVEKTSTSGLVDTYTITYTNGNTTTFDVSNGNGIDRIEKTATVGNKDTYTIYFTNGSTTTYEVVNGEVTREELEEEVERLSMIYNAFPSTTGEVEEGSINGTAEVPFKEIGLKGNTSQESTTGKNLANIKNIPNQTGQPTLTVANDTISISNSPSSIGYTSTNIKLSDLCPNLQVGDTAYLFYNTTSSSSQKTIIYLSGVNVSWAYNGGPKTITQEMLDSTVILYGGKDETAIISNFMITKTSDSDYEPYTGGNPAPNPDYPYPVNVVTGDNEVKVGNKNILSPNFSDYTLTPTGYYGYIKLTNENLMLSITDKDTNVDLTGCYLGWTENGETSGNGVKWIISNGEKVSESLNNVRTSEINYEYISFYPKNEATFNKIFSRFNVMVERNTTATPYEEHKEQTYPINLGSMELCKIGDYQDVIKRSSGKNLIDLNKHTNTLASNTTILSPNSFQCENTGTWQGRVILSFLNLKANTEYTFSMKSTSVQSILSFVRGIKNGTSTALITSMYVPYLPSTFNTSDYDEIQIDMYARGNGGSNGTITVYDIELFEGSYTKTTIPAFEPYGKVWHKYGAIGKVVLDGNTNFGYQNDRFIYNSNDILKQTIENRTIIVLSNYYKGKLSTYRDGVENNNIAKVIGDNNQIAIHDDRYTVVSDFQTWLSTHNLILYFVLATPTITPITDTTLIEQLDNLEKAYSYDTQTNISQTNQDKPFIISYEAILSLRNVLNS